MPDAKTMGRWGRALGPHVIKQIHERIVQIAHAKRLNAAGDEPAAMFVSELLRCRNALVDRRHLSAFAIFAGRWARSMLL
jgi:hypothetical protein